MKYTLNYNDKDYELQENNAKNAMIFDKYYKIAIDAKEDMKERLEACMMCLIAALTVEVAEQLIPDVNAIDINELFIITEKIHLAYSKPFVDFKSENAAVRLADMLTKTQTLNTVEE